MSRFLCALLFTLQSFSLLVITRASQHGQATQMSSKASLTLRSVSADKVKLSAVAKPGFASYSFKVVKELPHDGKPFTQGLEFSPDEKHLIETSGSFPPGTPSTVRIVDPDTGTMIKSIDSTFDGTFLEGIVAIPGSDGKQTWLTSTYDTNVAFELDSDFNLVSKKKYPWEGWGLARDVQPGSLLATNGSEYLMRVKPSSDGGFDLVDTKPVTCFGKRVAGINELEMIDDLPGADEPRLAGNLMGTRVILFINPKTAECTGAFHLQDLTEAVQTDEAYGYHVANGVAYSKKRGSFFVTGKNWNKMFEVKLQEGPGKSTAAGEVLQTFLATAPAVPPGHHVSLLESETSPPRRLSQIPIQRAA